MVVNPYSNDACSNQWTQTLFEVLYSCSDVHVQTRAQTRRRRATASPCRRGGLWPPTIWYRFAYSLFPAIPSLPRDFALLQAFGVGLRHARGFASDRALAAAFSATCGISLEKY